jgi:4-hydroxybenzoate polyprenyltransferase
MLLKDIFRRLVDSLEDPRRPFSYYLFLFLSAVTLRNFLEIFSDRAQVSFCLFSPQDDLYFAQGYSIALTFLHYLVFWVALFLLAALIIFFFTRAQLLKILKSVLSFSFLLILTPLVDLLTSGGQGQEISYAHPQSLLELFPLPPMATPGMLLTFFLALALAFSYCRVKTKNTLKSLGAVLTLYLSCVLLSALPTLVGASHPVFIIRALLAAIFGEVLLISYYLNPGYSRALLVDTRWMRLLHHYAMFLLGLLISGQGFWRVIQTEKSAFLLTSIAISLAWLAAVIFNNLEDCEIDRVSNSHRPLTSGAIPREDYRRIGLAIFSSALIFGLGVNFITCFFILLLMGNSLLYSLPPLRLKRVPIFSKLFIALDSLVLVMLGFIFSGRELLSFPRGLVWYFLVLVTLSANFIDLKDYAGDQKAGIKTLPVLLGLPRAKLLLGGFLLLTYSFLGLALVDLRITLGGLALGVAQFFLVNKKEYRELWVFALHLAGIILLFIYLALFYAQAL